MDVHTIPLEVEAEKEEHYRKAALILNERFVIFRKRMPLATSPEKIWLYIALECCVNLMSDRRDKALEPIYENIEKLNTIIEDVLDSSPTEQKMNIK